MQLSDLEGYRYDLPSELIAQEHAEPRDSSRLLVYHTKTGEIEHAIFRNILQYIPQETAVVFNRSHVVPARLLLQKKSGGGVQALLLLNESTPEHLRCIINKPMKSGDTLYLKGAPVLQLVERVGMEWLCTWVHSQEVMLFLEAYGTTPLPPYIKHNHQTEQEKRISYQAVFAEKSGFYSSVAAPTASLHFTEELLGVLRKIHTEIDVELAVGLGTFASLTELNFKEKKLHSEWVSMQAGEYQKLQTASSIMAVGTTALRTLESIDQIDPDGQGNRAGFTDIFITPPHKFRYASALLTNFHVPCSSLMLLVEAFLQHKSAKHTLIEIYEIAIQNHYKFYSLGDAMLIVD